MSSVAEKLAKKSTRRTSTKQVRLKLVYIDFWSSVKLSFLVAVCLAIVTIVATFLIFTVLNQIMVWLSTVKIRNVATIVTMARQTATRNDSFTLDQKSMYTSLRRTCFVDVRRVDFLASFSATLLIYCPCFLRGAFLGGTFLGGFSQLGHQIAFGVLRYAYDPVLLRKFREDHAHSVASLGRDFSDVRAYHLAAFEDDEYFGALVDDQSAHQVAPVLV